MSVLSKGACLLIASIVASAAGAAGGFDFNGAIDACARAGGGRVTVPAGEHLSNGPIVLKSNVELHLEEGAVIRFSDRAEDYLPGVPVSWEGNECVNVSPLVYAFGATNIAITGKGVFKPKLDFWRTWYEATCKRDPQLTAAGHTLKNVWAQNDVPLAERQLWKIPGAKFRPQLFHFNRCRNVRLEGFASKGTPFWTVHFFLCTDVVARNLDIDAYDDAGKWIGNSDGIDLECTRNALVEGCTFHQHDDAIVIKSGKDRDGRRIATPTENVVVRNCTVRGGPTFVAIGSELSGGIRNILVENCRVTDDLSLLVNIKTNPRRGGFVDGVTVRNIEARGVKTDLVRVMTRYFYGCPGEEKLQDELVTRLSRLKFSDIHATRAQRALNINGDASAPIDGLTVRNVRADVTEAPDVCSFARLVEDDEEPLTWGGRAAHPAVVNPVTGPDPANVVSLRGEWDYMLPDRDIPSRNGAWRAYATNDWARDRKIVRRGKLSVPGCWEAQGLGEPGESICWTPSWDNGQRPIRHKHMGEVWYRKSVTVPANWAGKRIWLKIGGVKSIGWVWVNGVQVALVDNYCATEKYEITDLVKPGETAVVLLDVDNRKPSRKGLMSNTHKWGGIYRDIELEATPQTFIDDAWVRGDFDEREAMVQVAVEGKKVGGESRWTADGCLFLRGTVENETVEVPLSTSTSTYSLHLPLRAFRPWSPEHPNLYTAKVELVEKKKVEKAGGGVGGGGERILQTRLERFGVRKLEVRGKDLSLNGKPFFVRGFGDDFHYPLTGMSPADRDFHRAHLKKARAAGFNYVRLHTHCELPEYFEAADELGIMIQAELPYYSDVPAEDFAFDPKRDATELWKNYRRHPSFAVYSMGNEGTFGHVLDSRLHRYIKAMDPDRLKINQDGSRLIFNPPDTADFVGGPINVWKYGAFDPNCPFVAHEYLNLCVKSDYRDGEKFTGPWMPPVTMADRAAFLAKFGLGLDWGARLQDAQNVLQGVWQKNGIEAARRDPYCDGYDYWTIIDVAAWNPDVSTFSGQGLFNTFWEEKRCGTTAKEFAVFNSPSVVLCDLLIEKRVWVAGETLKTDVYFAHYGDEPVRKGAVRWTLRAGGRDLAAGTFDVGDQALGASRKIGAIACEIPSVAKSVKASLEIALAGSFVNSWDLWLFPKGPSKAEILKRAAAAGITVASKSSSEAQAALAAGKKLLTIDETYGRPNIHLGWWWMGEQVGTAMKDHPALGDFPHEGAMTPLWFRLVKKGLPLGESDAKADEMIVVGEGGKACFLYLAERRIGASPVIESHGLDLLSDLPEANALLANLVSRLAGF